MDNSMGTKDIGHDPNDPDAILDLEYLGHSDWIIYAVQQVTGHVYFIDVETSPIWYTVAAWKGVVDTPQEAADQDPLGEEQDDYFMDQLSMEAFIQWMQENNKFHTNARIGSVWNPNWQRVKDMHHEWDLEDEQRIKNKFSG